MSDSDLPEQLRQVLKKYDPADPLIQELLVVADATDSALQGDAAPLEAWRKQWLEKRKKLKQGE